MKKYFKSGLEVGGSQHIAAKQVSATHLSRLQSVSMAVSPFTLRGRYLPSYRRKLIRLSGQWRLFGVHYAGGHGGGPHYLNRLIGH